MVSISSDEVNFLVYRYLQESGFVHSAFTFAYESVLAKSKAAQADVPPGALIAFLQKGLQFVDIEAHLNEDGSERQEVKDVGLLTPHVCQMLSGFDDPRLPPSGGRRGGGGGAGEQPESKRHKRGGSGRDEDGGGKSGSKKGSSSSSSSSSTSGGGKASKQVATITPEAVSTLRAHSREVFTIAWAPGSGASGVAGSSSHTLASGAADSCARVWEVPSGPCGVGVGEAVSRRSIELRHAEAGADPETSPDVTTVDWNREGTLLATGSSDGIARIWDRRGGLKATLREHTGSIFSLKWSRNAQHLLSASFDESAIVWDVATGAVKQHFKKHTMAVLDVDWQSDTTFATCSTDKAIHICRVDRERPIRSFVGSESSSTGHRDEVNAIKWDPSGTLLASCSDDCTAKLWKTDRDSCVHDFREHSKQIYTIQWSACGPGSANPSKQLLLATYVRSRAPRPLFLACSRARACCSAARAGSGPPPPPPPACLLVRLPARPRPLTRPLPRPAQRLVRL